MYLNKIEGKLIEKNMLYKWCNDSECRKNSLQTHKITYEEHCAWFKNKMEDKNCYMYIAKVEDRPVGQIRVDIQNNEGLISYSVAKEYRGNGIGKEMLSSIEEQSEICDLVDYLVATVKKDNIGSRRCFEKIGYKGSLNKDVYRYIKNIKTGKSLKEMGKFK